MTLLWQDCVVNRRVLFGHVDHGKSTFAGSLLIHTSSVSQLLDTYESERLGGKTVEYCTKRIEDLTCIDTPGHMAYLPEVINTHRPGLGVLVMLSIEKECNASISSIIYRMVYKALFYVDRHKRLAIH